MGLEAKVGGSGKQIVGREGGKIVVEEEIAGSKRGEKRKFELDEDELLRIAREERTKARKAIDEEKVRMLLLSVIYILTRSRLPKLHYHLSGYPQSPQPPTPIMFYIPSRRRQNNLLYAPRHPRINRITILCIP